MYNVQNLILREAAAKKYNITVYSYELQHCSAVYSGYQTMSIKCPNMPTNALQVPVKNSKEQC